MKLLKVAGITSEIWQIFIQDKTKTDGSGLTGLAFNTSGLTAYYHRDTDTTATAISLVTMTVGTFTSSGFKEIDATNMPGWYQFCPPNAALASGAKSCAFHLQSGGNMAPLPIEVQLSAVNPDSATNFETSVPSVAGAVGSVTGNVGGNVVGSVGSVVGLTASNLDATVSSRATPAQVATQVDTVINTNTKSELAAVPASNASIGDKITFIEMKIRNAETQNATQATIANTSGTVIGTAPVSDDGTTFTKGKYA